MFHRVTSVVASALMMSGAAVALSPAAQAAPPTHTGFVQVVVDDTVASCVGGTSTYLDLEAFTTDPAQAHSVTIAEGLRQNLVLTTDPERALGLNDHDNTLASGRPGAYGFLSRHALTAPGTPGQRQTAIWSIDPVTKALSASYVRADASAQPLGGWDYDYTVRKYVGLAPDPATFAAQHAPYAREVSLRLGDTCSGPITPEVEQTITFTSTAPVPARPGQTYTVTATGGASGNAVTFTSRTTDECTIVGSTVTFHRAGTCTIAADQAAATGYLAADRVEQDIEVGVHATSLDLSFAPANPVTGQGTTATAQLATTGGSLEAAGGLVAFSVDGRDVGAVAHDSHGRASTSLDLGVGTHQVEATWWPEANYVYDSSSDSGTVTVAAASTTTTVKVAPKELTATVAPVAPGAGTPAGDVTFRVDGDAVGTAPLANGTARLAHTVPADGTHVVSAEYLGSADFTASASSTSRANPRLSARVTSSQKARGGWYRTPVTISFMCENQGATLATACPKPIRVSEDGPTTVTRTIRSTDGGIATVSASVKLDRGAPTVAVRGVKAGRSYFDAPRPTCSARDSLSGVKTCKVTSKRSGSKVVVTATATDVAGNVRTKRVTYRTASFTIRGAKKVAGAYRVKHGQTYTLVVKGARARYVYAAPAPGTPNRGSVPFRKAGPNTWALGVTMSMTTSATRSWNLGYTQGGKLHVVKVKVVG